MIGLTASCLPTVVCTSGQLRLEGGASFNQGRVEVCRDQLWGTVCDDMWDAADGAVACRQLGFSGFGEELLVV